MLKNFRHVVLIAGFSTVLFMDVVKSREYGLEQRTGHGFRISGQIGVR